MFMLCKKGRQFCQLWETRKMKYFISSLEEKTRFFTFNIFTLMTNGMTQANVAW